MKKMMAMMMAGAVAVTSCVTTTKVAAPREFTVAEPFGLAWGPDRVSFDVAFEKGDIKGDAIGARGQGLGASLFVTCGEEMLPAQLDDITLWKDGSVKGAKVVFMVTLKPDETKQYIFVIDSNRPESTRVDSNRCVAVTERDGIIEIVNGLTGIRLPAGGREDFPAPIQGIRLPGGAWMGKGEWQTRAKGVGYTATVEAAGPVFARVRLSYTFAGTDDKASLQTARGCPPPVYEAVVELYAGQDLAIVSEEYAVGAGRDIDAEGLLGFKEGETFRYVMPSFESPDKALIWDWWAGTQARLPIPDHYTFSLSENFAPDSATFRGYNKYKNVAEGDGGLTFDKDGRFLFINAYLQWGEEESQYLGLWNQQAPSEQVAIVALRPADWLHPDIAPRPDRTIQQYTQTSCPRFLRSTGGKVWMEAPVGLGKRVYGIGGVERTFEKHLLAPQGDIIKRSEEESWGSNLMLRHIRLGSVMLDEVKDWVLFYDEPGKYPRMYVEEGDYLRYVSRALKVPVEEVTEDSVSEKQERQTIDSATTALRNMVQHFAQSAYGGMTYGISLGNLSTRAEAALSARSVTEEEKVEIRRWLAALMYQAFNPNYEPPRAAGYAWGSANMKAQVECRACYILSLIPNHPKAAGWANALAYTITLYAESQINDAGATLECPHYGGMAITMPAMAMTALDNNFDVDLSRVADRLRAAAVARINMMYAYDIRGGFRPYSVEGDGYYNGDGTFGILLGFFQKRDPELASRLAWAMNESNGRGGAPTAVGAAHNLFDTGVEGSAPELTTTHIPGYGFTLRNGNGATNETLLHVYAGGFSWGHGHNDRGTWVLYARGVPLMMDFAGMYTPSIRQVWQHPGGLVFDVDETVRAVGDEVLPEDKWWREGANADVRDLRIALFTVTEPTRDPAAEDEYALMGVVSAFEPGERADYARMERDLRYLTRDGYALPDPHGVNERTGNIFFNTEKSVTLEKPFRWTRQYLLVKDDLAKGRDYVVIRDDIPGNEELKPYLNLWALAESVDVKGNTFVYTGQHGVDIHGYFASPTAFDTFTRTLGHPCGFGFAPHYKATFGKDFREDQIQLRISPEQKNAPFFFVMVPVAQGEEPPVFATLSDGAISVTFKGGTDIVGIDADGKLGLR